MKSKIIIIIILFIFFLANYYSLFYQKDSFTQSKINFSKLDGKVSYLGRFQLWQLLVQNSYWDHAATLESGLNPNEVSQYKQSHQPQQIAQKITDLENNSQKTTDDYLELAKYQSFLGLSQEAINSIKKAHQLDPIRSDVDKLFYTLAK